MEKSVAFYNEQVRKLRELRKSTPDIPFDKVISYDEKKISWSSSLTASIDRLLFANFEPERNFDTIYRPFSKQVLYYGEKFIHRRSLTDSLFPTNDSQNITICLSSGNKGVTAITTNGFTDLHMAGDTQCFPLYYYEENEKAQLDLFNGADNSKYIRHDGITDWILKEVRGRFSGTKMINKETIFYYVYGLLHSPQYRARFADDLKKSLPRIPIVDKIEDFMLFSKIGKQLADLHLNYEQVPPAEQVKVYKSSERVDQDNYAYYSVEKMRFEKVRDENGKLVPDKSVIIYNNNIRLENIPLEAYDYIVNGKSAIEWIMERYAISTDSASGITNDPNDWSKEHQKPTYILDLLLSIINLSLQTNKLVDQLPTLPFALDASKHEASKQREKKSTSEDHEAPKDIYVDKTNPQGAQYVFNGPVNIYQIDTIHNENDDHSQHLNLKK